MCVYISQDTPLYLKPARRNYQIECDGITYAMLHTGY